MFDFSSKKTKSLFSKIIVIVLVLAMVLSVASPFFY